MQHKNIIFDFGGVLIDVDYLKTIDAFKAIGITDFEQLYSQAQQERLFDRYETGKISSQYFINQLIGMINKPVTPNKVVSAWNAMLGAINTENIKAVEKLKNSGYNVFLLSNTNDIHIKVALDRWNKESIIQPEQLFQKIYLSQEIGLRKPDTEIFEFVLNDIGAVAEDALFIDDSIQHIESASSLGIHTHLLKDINTLSDFLLTEFDQ